MPRNSSLFVVVSVDTDDDGYDRSASLPGPELSWAGVEKGIPLLVETLADIVDTDRKPVKFTWFVRCDEQLRQLYGDEAYLFGRFEDFWITRSKNGDELAWHPHLYDHDASLMSNEAGLRRLLKNSYDAVVKKKFNISSSRLGRSICSNSLLAGLSELGIRTDSTAMPGKIKKDEYNMIDWSGTPNQPFKPSKADCRVPGAEQSKILEVPMSMISTQTSYDRRPINRYINLTFKNVLIDEALRRYVRENDLLVSIMHPSEVVLKTDHPLLSYDIKEVKKNLAAILDESRRADKQIEFVTVDEVRDLVEKGIINAASN